MDDALPDDDVADDMEPNIIADDSGNDIAAGGPAGVGGGSSSGAQQYPPHFSSLDLDAMRQEGVLGKPIRFDASDTQGTGGLSEFQVGQRFQDKEEAVLSVKTGIWEVKWYNGPHTCLATSISSDHRSLDYHVILAFIMPMIRADASICIKVLLNATEAHFRFRPAYKRVWLAKQKAMAQIYRDWDESYNELSRWVLGVQLTMPGSVAVLRTSAIRVGGQVDDSQAYFHRLFWTFPPLHARVHR
ncbi:uncharacterized protein LOC107647501 [Arachis ipaensis]|uniref:uncharacterized protein LOC107647501 n=1 Tax=Arachis ipaensis TaxID=130454 RepID=UPI0007AF7DE7|nr:uncharacterized protein LOC107647501 [Arachis ipaensis]